MHSDIDVTGPDGKIYHPTPEHPYPYKAVDPDSLRDSADPLDFQGNPMHLTPEQHTKAGGMSPKQVYGKQVQGNFSFIDFNVSTPSESQPVFFQQELEGLGNVCNIKGQFPLMYHHFTAEDCGGRHILNGSQFPRTCPGANDPKTGCASFCQKTTTYKYGEEIPFVGTWVKGPRNLRYNSVDEAYTTRVSYPLEDLAEGQCGYWTFVPIVKEVCGVYSESELTSDGGCGATTSTTLCDIMPTLNSNGEIQGNTIFVDTDCGSREPWAPQV
ncbi:hypothetical protein F5Y16DRAFT_415838 [Xylariaceae sp. FL0255]|nr:hypothetical protein F5Y16DRAFT_415838 [Xylariaceae sp. FL0255]